MKYPHDLNIHHWWLAFHNVLSVEVSIRRVRGVKAEATDAIFLVLEKVKSQL